MVAILGPSKEAQSRMNCYKRRSVSHFISFNLYICSVPLCSLVVVSTDPLTGVYEFHQSTPGNIPEGMITIQFASDIQLKDTTSFAITIDGEVAAVLPKRSLGPSLFVDISIAPKYSVVAAISMPLGTVITQTVRTESLEVGFNCMFFSPSFFFLLTYSN